MQFAFTEEQSQFRDIVARFCRDKFPTPTVRRLIDTDDGFDAALWKQLCEEVGVTGIHIPEDKGGVGFGAVELGIVMEEFGRALVPAPYFSTAVLACTAIAEIEDSARREALLGSIMAGQSRGTLVLEETHGDPIVSITESGGKLSGTCNHVLDAHTADFILAVADNHRLYLVQANAEGLESELLPTMDTSRKQARVTFTNTPAESLGKLTDGQLKRIYNIALVAHANEMIGGAQALLDSAVEYTKLRYQFGRAIGSFQAIKHRLADLLVDVELARVGAYQAAAALDADEDVSTNASLAKSVASETYMKAALECIQLHGGIGFTWENDTHLWFRRAKTSEVFLGTAAFHRERMLKEMQL